MLETRVPLQSATLPLAGRAVPLESPGRNAAALSLFDPLGRAGSESEVWTVAANEAAALLHAPQALAWRCDALGRVRLAGVAGLSRVERHNGFAQAVESLARALGRLPAAAGDGLAQPLPEPLDDATLAASRAEHLLAHVLHLPLRGPDGLLLGGMLVARDAAPFRPDEAAALASYGRMVASVAWGWRAQRLLPLDRGLAALRRPRAVWALPVALAVLLAWPVRQSAIASAEISARAPVPITATQDGVVERVLVRPNQAVTRGQPLLRFDAAVVRNKLDVAQQAVQVADAELRRASGKAFIDEAARAELQTLRARVRERQAEARYLEELNQRLQIVAPADGTAIFADAEAWTGRPVQTGERIMQVANPAQVWVTLYLPPEEDLPARERAPVSLNLDIAPLQTIRATVVESSYEAGTAPDGRPAFVLRAMLDAGTPPPRIGLRGSATVYADRAALGYVVMRKPLRALRRFIGV